MKPNDLKIDINVNLSVSEEMAERCCRILEFYLDDNPDKRIMCDTQEDNTMWVHIEDKCCGKCEGDY